MRDIRSIGPRGGEHSSSLGDDGRSGVLRTNGSRPEQSGRGRTVAIQTRHLRRRVVWQPEVLRKAGSDVDGQVVPLPLAAHEAVEVVVDDLAPRETS